MLKAIEDLKILNLYDLNIKIDINNNISIIKYIKEFNIIKIMYEKKIEEIKELHNTLQKIDLRIKSIIDDNNDNNDIEKSIIDVSKYLI